MAGPPVENRLPPKDVERFYRLYHSLLAFANRRLNVIRGLETREQILRTPIEKVAELRERFFRSPEIIGDFVSENPARLSKEELEVVKSWKNHRKGEFYLMSHGKAHSVFYDPKARRAYGVVALMDPFEKVVPHDPPVLVKGVLLPFRGRITYDSILNYFPIHFGGGMRRSFRAETGDAIRKWGVITSLDGEPKERRLSDEENLRFYLKSAANRERYWKEINRLRNKSPELKAIFHREAGRHNARRLKAKLEELGARGLFAVVDDVVVAGAPDEKALDRALRAVVPEEKLEWVHRFRI